MSSSARARRLGIALATALLAVSSSSPAAPDEPVPPPPEQALATILPADALQHVTTLASAKMEGRASGLAGGEMAGKYVVEQVTAYGLEPAGPDKKYEQPFEIRLMPFPGQGASDEAKGQPGTTYNVCALLRGADAKLKEEYVVVSAHYDHVGRGKKKIWYGAGDNASGTSALLEVAQAFTAKGAPPPRRSILFLFFSAEERGLLGSKHFTEKPTVPLASIVCDLNIDMVGRNKSKEMDVYGNATSSDLDSAHLRAAEKSGLTFFPKTGQLFLRSDQVNFYEKDIPCLFWTCGLYKEYHTPKDDAAHIDEAKVAKAAVHAYCTAWEIANRTARPGFKKMDKNASSGPLGAVLDPMPAEEIPQAKLADGEGAVLVRSVLDGTPAFEAKLQPGDLVLGIADDPLPDGDPVGAVEEAVKAAVAKGRIVLRIMRGTKVLRVTLKL